MQIQSTSFATPMSVAPRAAVAQPTLETNEVPDVATIQANAAALDTPAVSAEAATKSGSNLAKFGAMALVGLAAFGAMASPALAQRHHGGHNHGGHYQVRPYNNPYSHGHHHGGGWGHGGGWNRPIPIPIPIPIPVPVPTYPTYPGGGYNLDAGRHHTFQGNATHGAHHYAYGADGVYHHFDEFGHVNDATGHYSICRTPMGGWYYSNTGTCW